MTQKRYEEIKATLLDKKWNAAEFAAKAEKLLPELFAGIDAGEFEPEPEKPVEISSAQAESINTTSAPVGEPIQEPQSVMDVEPAAESDAEE